MCGIKPKARQTPLSDKVRQENLVVRWDLIARSAGSLLVPVIVVLHFGQDYLKACISLPTAWRVAAPVLKHREVQAAGRRAVGP